MACPPAYACTFPGGRSAGTPNRPAWRGRDGVASRSVKGDATPRRREVRRCRAHDICIVSKSGCPFAVVCARDRRPLYEKECVVGRWGCMGLRAAYHRKHTTIVIRRFEERRDAEEDRLAHREERKHDLVDDLRTGDGEWLWGGVRSVGRAGVQTCLSVAVSGLFKYDNISSDALERLRGGGGGSSGRSVCRRERGEHARPHACTHTHTATRMHAPHTARHAAVVAVVATVACDSACRASNKEAGRGKSAAGRRSSVAGRGRSAAVGAEEYSLRGRRGRRVQP